jgi:chorismate mutase
MTSEALTELFRERAGLVLAASAHKTSHAGVQAPARVAEVMANVRVAAAEAGLDPDGIEACYRTLVGLFISFEAAAFADRKTPGGPPALTLPEIRTRIDALDRRIVAAAGQAGVADAGALLLGAARAVIVEGAAR